MKYEVNITNGSGSQNMKAGTYSVSAKTARGYDLTSLNPTSFTATTSGTTGAFTLTASGTLTFTINETGASGGTPITSGTIVMTDSSGDTQYGQPVNISNQGVATFNNVPYGDTDSPYTLYFKQLTSDDNHNVYDGVITVNMTNETQNEYVINSAIVSQSFTLTDATYTGLPISATLEFNDN